MSTSPTHGVPSSTLQTLCDALPDAALLLDRAGVVVASNAAWRDLATEASSVVAGRSSVASAASAAGSLFLAQIDTLFPSAAADQQVFSEGLRAIAANERPRWDANRLYEEHGEARCLSLTLSQLRIEGHDGVLVQVRRTTEPLRRRQAEAELSEAKARFERLMAVTTESVFLSERGRILDLNPAALVMFRYSAEQMLGMDATELIAPETRETALPRLQANEPGVYEARLQRSDGSSFDAELTASSVSYEGRLILGTAVRDISERKRAERSVRDSEERFRLLAEMTSEAMVLSEGAVTFDVNKAMTNLLGFSREELVGNSVLMVTLPEHHGRVRNSMLSNTPDPYEILVLHKDGSHIPVVVTARLLPHQGRVVRGATLRDLRPEQQAEAAIRLRLAQEEKLSAQAAVLAELSTPLIPINDRIVVMPLIGALDDQRAARAMEVLLSGIQQSGATIAILDITGVPGVDSHVADALVRAAHAARLVGAQVVLTGIRPDVAQTLVTLGANLSGINTYGTLQSGIAYAMARRRAG